MYYSLGVGAFLLNLILMIIGIQNFPPWVNSCFLVIEVVLGCILYCCFPPNTSITTPTAPTYFATTTPPSPSGTKETLTPVDPVDLF